MPEINWLQAVIEAPLAVVLALCIYKCYRARVRVGLDSPCFKWCSLKFKLDMPGALREIPSDDSADVPPSTPEVNHFSNRGSDDHG
jgi:hypothetical protein